MKTKAAETGKAKFYLTYISTTLPHTRFSNTVRLALGRFATLAEAAAEAHRIAKLPKVRKNRNRVRMDIRHKGQLVKRVFPKRLETI